MIIWPVDTKVAGSELVKFPGLFFGFLLPVDFYSLDPGQEALTTAVTSQEGKS
jgi:hypothetical protein